MSSLKSERAHWGVYFKTSWRPIDVRTMKGEDAANYVYDKLCHISDEKAKMEEENYDGIISNEVLVLTNPDTVSYITEKCCKRFKLRSQSSDSLIIFV